MYSGLQNSCHTQSIAVGGDSHVQVFSVVVLWSGPLLMIMISSWNVLF